MGERESSPLSIRTVISVCTNMNRSRSCYFTWRAQGLIRLY